MTAAPRGGRRAEVAVAVVMLVAVVVHEGGHVARGAWWDVFWICNASAALLPLALALRQPIAAQAALTWLLPGTLVWLIDVAVSDATIIATSYGVHVGGVLVAVFAVRRLGYARRGYLGALGLLCAVLLVSRVLLPAAANVNAAHRVPDGWSFLGSSRGAFVATSVALVALLTAAGQLLGRTIALWGRARPDSARLPPA